jgi:hypothetical protein
LTGNVEICAAHGCTAVSNKHEANVAIFDRFTTSSVDTRPDAANALPAELSTSGLETMQLELLLRTRRQFLRASIAW